MALKETMYVEFNGNQVSQKSLFDSARQIWKDNGNRVKDLSIANLYYKPDEGKCYYVLNEGAKDEMSGSFDV